jgi:hypothetical protein
MEAALRREMMRVQDLSDRRHLGAVEFALKNYTYNRALHRSQVATRRGRLASFPTPEEFGLFSDMLERKDQIAESEIDAVRGSRNKKPL